MLSSAAWHGRTGSIRTAKLLWPPCACSNFIAGAGHKIVFICIWRVAVTRSLVPAVALQPYPETGSIHNGCKICIYFYGGGGGGGDDKKYTSVFRDRDKLGLLICIVWRHVMERKGGGWGRSIDYDRDLGQINNSRPLWELTYEL